MASLDPHLAHVLALIARADAGEHCRFKPIFVQQSEAPVLVTPEVDEIDKLLPGPMGALQALGYLDIDAGAPGEYGAFQLTAAGRDAAARNTPRSQDAPTEAVDLSWENVEPVLRATVQEWEHAGAGAPIDVDVIAAAIGGNGSPQFVSRALQALEKDGWVELEHEMGTAGPIAAAPEPKALAWTRGWPTPGSDSVVVARLLQALDEAIVATDDPAEKSRLERLRSAAGDVGKSVLAGAIVAAGKAATGGA